MTDRRYINFAPLERYSPKVRASLIRRYHALYTYKYDWFVRQVNEASFYCNGERPDVAGAEIFNCNWTNDTWYTVPYKHFYNPIQGVWYTSYARQGLPPLAEYNFGYTREDSIVMKDGSLHFVYFSEGTKYVWWSPNDDRFALKLVHDGWYTLAHSTDDGYTFEEGTFMHTKPVKKPNIDTVMKVAKRMNAKKYRGVYRPLIDKLVEIYGLNSSQI